MPLIKNVPTVRIDLSTPGEWVEVKSALSKGDQTRARVPSFRLEVSRDSQNIDAAQALDAITFAALEVGIVSWSFDEKVTAENIRALSVEDYDIITERCNELWSPRSDDEVKNSSGAGLPSASVEGQSPKNSDGS